MEVELTLNVPPRRPRRRARPKATETPAAPLARLPRITRLMALAIKFQDMADRGEVRDYADLARLGYVSRARMTQIMNLLNLAPDIQEYLLLLSGDARMLPERQLRPLARRVRWADQRALWAQLLDQRSLRATLALG
jgi:hypothetical protein